MNATGQRCAGGDAPIGFLAYFGRMMVTTIWHWPSDQVPVTAHHWITSSTSGSPTILSLLSGVRTRRWWLLSGIFSCRSRMSPGGRTEDMRGLP